MGHYAGCAGTPGAASCKPRVLQPRPSGPRGFCVMGQPPLILLTNDDGVQAPGLHALRDALEPMSKPVVVAPASEQSATSHSITLQRPLFPTQHGPDVYALDGTPADCVYVALFSEHFLPRRPDLVVSGINHGVNLGTDIFYSGTVAGAREAAIRGIPAIALSHAGADGFGEVAEQARKMALRLLEVVAPDGPPVLLNVNFPRGPIKGVRTTRLARRLYEGRVLARHDPYGREYFWLGGNPVDRDHAEGSDTQALRNGFVSVTPLALEVIDAQHMATATAVAEAVATAENPIDMEEP